MPAMTICLYGTHEVGAGYIATDERGKQYGNGDPVKGRNFTSALWLAMNELRGANPHPHLLVVVYEPSGRMFARVSLQESPYFGELKWEPCVVTCERKLVAQDGNEVRVEILGAPGSN